MKGVYILIGIIVVTVFFCGIVPFTILPGQGLGMALPVVSVPGEILSKDFLGISGFNLTNTIVGTLLADIVVLVFALSATRSMKEVPGRLQGLFEILTDALYGLAKSTAGQNAKKIFPLMATVFLFLLVANWLELVPGVDSIGVMHCAEEGFNGYEKEDWRLYVDQPLYQGERATEENYELCHAKEEGHVHEAPAVEYAKAAALETAAAQLGVELIDWKDDVGNGNTLASYVNGEGGDVDAVYTATVAMIEAEYGDELVADDAEHAEDAEVDSEGDAEAEDDAAEGDGHDDEAVAMTPEELADMALYEEFFRDDIYIVTPFVRAAATDLNLTLGLGLFAFIAIQVFGVQALGMSYFSKFINTPALGNMNKNPMGAMDFVVGLLEIISELAKVLSFGFRLFGNIFAGQVLLFVMAFLVAWILPSIFYGLELFVGLIQAFVFAMLLLVFSSMAMQGHHGDEEHH